MASTVYERHVHTLLREQLSDEEVERRLAPFGFIDRGAAYRRLRVLATHPAIADCLPNLLAALSEFGHADRILATFERFVHSLGSNTATLRTLAADQRAMEMLVTIFASSQFLSEILLNHPQYFDRLLHHRRVSYTATAADYLERARREVAPETAWSAQIDRLRRFQRWQLLRIGACDLLDLWDLRTVTEQLSALADSLVQACLELAAQDTGIDPSGFAVLAMGKLGGRELNYSSDIDLIFVSRGDGLAYRKLGERLIDGLTCVTPAGFLYRVDMRLRPWGSTGPLVTSLPAYLSYLERDARPWEKQALLKARPIAGDLALGQRFLREIHPLAMSLDQEALQSDVDRMKRRIEELLVQTGRGWGEIKLGEGSIRDVEFLTQYLQLAYGHLYPDVLCANTLDGLTRIFRHGLIRADEYQTLFDGYIFLRTIEHHLQMMHYRQTHTLPRDTYELAALARRLGYRSANGTEQFLARYREYSQAIRSIYERYLRDKRTGNPMSDTHSNPAPPPSRQDATYASTFSEEELERHAQMAARLSIDNLVEIDAVPLGDGRWRLTIVGFDFLGELSLICGLLFAYGFNIIDGQIFSYEPVAEEIPPEPSRRRSGRRPSPPRPRPKIVDVFTVQPLQEPLPEDIWARYEADLSELLKHLLVGQQREAQGELAKRVAMKLPAPKGSIPTLYPVEITIDNEASEEFTVLHIDALDTVGFLYEFTNALALNGINIARMVIQTVGNRVQDTLYVTDILGQKITDERRQRSLRATTVLIKHFTHLLPLSPNPEAALLHFREFLGHLFMREDWPDELASLERPEVLNTLARLLGVSEFLWDDFLRMQHENLFPVVKDVTALAHPKSKAELEAELQQALSETSDFETRRDVLNAFKDREMFRIDMRHIQGHITEFGQFSGELTDLAEVVVAAAYELCLAELTARHGQPRLDDGSPSPMTVCALGKCGGRELGFASDIELMFIFAGNGRTTGPDVITTAEFYEKLVQLFLETIRARREGIFEIDLQLRPYGKQGNMAVSLEAFQRYFAPDGPAWPYERQALIRLRPIAGDPELGQRVTALRDAFVYTGEPFDVRAMQAMRERQIRHLVKGGTVNAKFSPGGLVDIEYLVQALQITHGHEHSELRHPNTREVMARLAQLGILSQEDYATLRQAHIFIRRLINALRMVRGNARDLTIPPRGSEEFAFLARRLQYQEMPDQLWDDILRHMSHVQAISQRLLQPA